jgi:hypothetical protein
MQAILKGLPSCDPLLKVPDFNYTELYQKFGLAGFRNKIINGAMNVCQYGTQGGNSFCLDRFYLEVAVSSATFAQTQSTDVPTFTQSGYNFQSSLKIDCTGTDTVSSTKAIDLIYKIEGYDWQDCNNKPLVCSFWVKSTKAGIYGFSLANNGADRNFVADYYVYSANTWEKKVIRIPPNPNAGTWLYTTGCGAALRWGFMAGSNYTTGPGWNTSSPRVLSANQTNFADSASNDFYLTGVQLEVGTVATQLESRTFGTELALAQRYCWQINSDVSNNQHFAYGAIPNGGTSTIWAWVKTPVTMRIVPSVSVSNLSDIGGIDTTTAASLASLAVTTNGSTPSYLFLTATQAASTWVGYRPAYLYVSNGSSRFVRFSAEL